MKRFLPILLGSDPQPCRIDPVWADRNPDLWMINALYETLLRNGRDGALVPDPD